MFKELYSYTLIISWIWHHDQLQLRFAQFLLVLFTIQSHGKLAISLTYKKQRAYS